MPHKPLMFFSDICILANFGGCWIFVAKSEALDLWLVPWLNDGCDVHNLDSWAGKKHLTSYSEIICDNPKEERGKNLAVLLH